MGARLRTSCNVNNEPFIHPAAVTWCSTAPMEHNPAALVEHSDGGAGSIPGGWGGAGSLAEPSIEVCCQDPKGGGSRERK